MSYKINDEIHAFYNAGASGHGAQARRANQVLTIQWRAIKYTGEQFQRRYDYTFAVLKSQLKRAAIISELVEVIYDDQGHRVVDEEGHEKLFTVNLPGAINAAVERFLKDVKDKRKIPCNGGVN
jgi:hypothetical protein